MKKKLMTVLTAVLLCSALCGAAAMAAPKENHPQRLVDEADLLDADEEAELTELLDEISERQQFDVVIVTQESLDGDYPEEFADHYYDYGGYGYGEEYDGALLLIDMEYREWHISTTGFGIKALNDAKLEKIEDKIVPDLSENEYMAAFVTFAELCDEYVSKAKSPLGILDMISIVRVLVSLVIGFLIALIPMTIMKGKLKSVHREETACDYIKKDSFLLTETRDHFLGSNITKKAKPKNNSSGGSRTHRSSSGRSHGGRGGRF